MRRVVGKSEGIAHFQDDGHSFPAFGLKPGGFPGINVGVRRAKPHKERAVIYARVSTDKQNYEAQLTHLRGWGAQRGFGVQEIYAETESAWSGGHQSELSRLVDDARKRKFDLVLVWSLDRVSREGPLAILQLVDLLGKWGVRILSYQESWTDAPGPIGGLLYAITGWVSQMESVRRSERTKAGIETARAKRGGRWGRPPGTKDSKKRKRRS